MRKRIFKAVAALAAFSLAAYLAPKKDKKQGASPVPLGESISYYPNRAVCAGIRSVFFITDRHSGMSHVPFLSPFTDSDGRLTVSAGHFTLWRTRKMFWLSVLNFQRKNIPVPAGIRKLI